MKIGRVMAALKSSKKLILIIVCLLYLTVAHSASISSPPCGCIEKDRLETLESVSSMVLGSSHSDDQTSKCNLFCSTKSGTHFVNLEQGICHCFSTSQLPTFDCDEILKSSNRNNSKQAVIPVYCVSSSLIQHLKLSSSSSNKPLAAKMKSGTTKSSDGKVDVQEEETQFSISKGIASAAIVLVTLSVVVLILFGLKTCYDNKKTVKLQGSEKCPKKNSSTWNFDEHKIKETRSENNI